MHRTPSSPLAACRGSQHPTVLWLAVIALPLLGGGCSSVAPAGTARYGCYDLRDRLEPTVATRAECEFRDWQWRERP